MGSKRKRNNKEVGLLGGNDGEKVGGSVRGLNEARAVMHCLVYRFATKAFTRQLPKMFGIIMTSIVVELGLQEVLSGRLAYAHL